MSYLAIVLDADRTDFEPGESIRAGVEWSLTDPPERIELRVFWNTVGKGTQDIGVEHTVTIDDPSVSGSCQITLELPEAPYSFSGQLVSLVWALEFVALPSGDSCRKEICIAPGRKEVVLTSIPK